MEGDTNRDANSSYDFFVHDRQTGATELASVGDSIAPKVTRVVPTEGATGIALKANLVATFSERMRKTTLTEEASFKLYKLVMNPDGTTTYKRITNVRVTLSSDGLKATLNPYGDSDTLLEKNTRYKAVVSEGALDVFGNPLDENLKVSGSQPKEWYFKTGG